MCGIAGFAGMPYAPEESMHRVRAMCDAIRHRGPDSDGYYVDADVALGMRRLSIIDVEGGRQPITNEDGSLIVVFNGEIYNHHELRTELAGRGHRFRTHSDTEVLVHAYEEYGPAMVNRLNGMFAFALWNTRTRQLFIARDRTGMKPLSYLQTADGIAFCSELRSLWTLLPQELQLSPTSVMQYLAFGYVPHPHSIFEKVRKLPPGHMLTWSAHDGLSIKSFWQPPAPDPSLRNESELIDQLRDLLSQAVAAHLESEVPLGAFLSGGLDSSTVVALMCRHAQGRIKTFSIGFAEDRYDESAVARSVAGEFGTEHTDLVLRPNVESMFEAIAGLFDEPFADSSAIPTFLVAQLARSSVTVALSGDGGDELFGGYSRYREILTRGNALPALIGRLLSTTGLMLPHFFPGRNRLVDLGRSCWGRYAATVAQPVRRNEGGIARAGVPGASVTINDQLHEYIRNVRGDDFASAMMQIDLQSYMPGDIHTKVDRTSMAVSLEARVPLLDTRLMDLALRIPGHLRVTARETKVLFRRAIRGIVPDSVLSRPKQGFEIPLGGWFRGPLRHRIESMKTPSSALSPFIDPHAMRRLVFEHTVGRRDHSAMLWRVMVLDSWLAMLARGQLGQPPRLPENVFDAAA